MSHKVTPSTSHSASTNKAAVNELSTPPDRPTAME